MGYNDIIAIKSAKAAFFNPKNRLGSNLSRRKKYDKI